MADETESRAVDIDINGKLKRFDIDDPVLPAWIEERALGSGGYPHDDKLDKDKYAKQLEKLQVELASNDLQTAVLIVGQTLRSVEMSPPAGVSAKPSGTLSDACSESLGCFT